MVLDLTFGYRLSVAHLNYRAIEQGLTALSSSLYPCLAPLSEFGGRLGRSCRAPNPGLPRHAIARRSSGSEHGMHVGLPLGAIHSPYRAVELWRVARYTGPMPSWAPHAALCAALACAAAGCGETRLPGTCPDDERCSTSTPRGLIFVGASLADRPPGELAALAVGGTQTLRMKLPAEDDDQVPAAFADTVAATVGAPFRLGAIDPPAVELVADDSGEGLLRILEPDGELLLDRAAVRAERAEIVELGPREHPDAPAWALYAAGEAELVVRITGETGARLVDEGVAVRAHGAAVKRRAWDLFAVAASAPEELEFELELSSGQTFRQAVRTAAVIDRIELALADADLAAHLFLRPGDEEVLCFAGRTEDGAAVAGLDWTFEALGPIEAEPWPALRRCALVRALEPGQAGLFARAADHELGFAIDVFGDDDWLPAP
jgi:hypothetical protein